MIKTISNTAFSLGIIAVLNFILITLVYRTLGSAGSEQMILIVLGISFVVLMNNMIGGAALVYLTPRKSVYSLLSISYLWAIASVIVVGSILYILELVPMEFFYYVMLISVLECVFSIHNQVLIGKKKIVNHNLLKILQKVIQLTCFIVLGITIQNFVVAIVISYLFVLILSVYFVKYHVNFKEKDSLKELFTTSIKYGFDIQSSNVVQLLNYRLLYYFIEKTMGTALGLYGLAVQLSESLWIPSKALAIIQYSELSNEIIEEKRKQLSLSFVKASFVITSVLLAILLLIPNSLFLFVFKKDVEGINEIILALSLGVLSIAVNQIFAHYLSGKGIYKYNVRASIIGFIVVVSLGWFAITNYGLIGAGIVTSLSYFLSSFYLAVIFVRESKSKLSDFFIRKEDVTRVVGIFKK
ncbi:polysaccharide biosynthesis C-terminal domain-containing protein [Flavobacteriales bacterium]|nr:polysaccharide biosynthesis C-terminal domain-containing protein [Flavobacteriales bacterium]